MTQKSVPAKALVEEGLKDIRRQYRLHYSAEDKIHIVMESLRGEESIAELCRREGRSTPYIFLGQEIARC